MRVLRNAIVGMAALVLGVTQSADVQAQFRRPTITDATKFLPADRQQLKQLMMGYINPTIISQHATNVGTIHCENTLFLTWHREYIDALEAWLMTQDWGPKYVPLPKWRPDVAAIPNEFYNSLTSPRAIYGSSTTYPNLTDQDLTSGVIWPFNLAQFITPSVCSNFPAASLSRACTGFSPGNALDNFARALERQHDNVHGNVGGIMGNALNSPAAAIFWLWHADVDDYYRYYQCQCSGLQQKNLFIKDTPDDTGLEPNTTTAPIWESPDIWVRQNADVAVSANNYQEQNRLLRHENPEYKALGGDNYIYVRVRNIGCQATTNSDAILRVYGTPVTIGGSTWSTAWTQITTLAGIGVPAMQPGEVKVIQVPWTVPNPALFPNHPSHYCLVARLESVADPMAVTEGTSIGVNTVNNNNIAWRNVEVYDSNPFNIAPPQDDQFTTVLIGAALANQNDAVLTFNFPENVGLNVTVDLGDELTALWEEGGTLGEGIRRLEGNRIRILQPGATIGGLALPEGETYLASVQAYLQANPEGGEAAVRLGDVVPLRMMMYEINDEGEQVLTGGVTHEIRARLSADEAGQLITEFETTSPSCPEASDGSIAIHGGDDYTYWWSNGSSESQIDGLTPGTYSVVVRSADGLVEERFFDLTSASTLQVDGGSTNSSCGQSNGSAMIGAAGGTPPYTYQWYYGNGAEIPGGRDRSIDGLASGLYRVRVTDAAGCQINSEVNVLEEMSMLGIGFTKQDASSPDATDGWAEVHATGMAPFSYQWSNGAVGPRIENLAAGTYSVTVIDGMGCSKNADVEIYSPQGRALQSVTDWESGASLMKILSVVPNPASDRAELNFTLVEPGTVRVEIYDELGKLVKFVEEASRLGGTNSVRIDTRTLTSGRYSLRLAIGNRGISTPLVIVK